MRYRYHLTVLFFLFLFSFTIIGEAAPAAKLLKYKDVDNNITLYASDNEKLAEVYEVTDMLAPLIPEPTLPELSNRLVNKWNKISRTAQLNNDGYTLLYKYRIKELPSIVDTTKTDALRSLKDEYFIEVEVIHSYKPHTISSQTDKITLLKLPYQIDGFDTLTSLPISKSYPFKPEFRDYNTLYIVFDKFRYMQVRLKPSLNFEMPSTSNAEKYPAIEGSKEIIDYVKQIDFKKVYAGLEKLSVEVPGKSNPTKQIDDLKSLN